jgi:hypothetical protein
MRKLIVSPFRRQNRGLPSMTDELEGRHLIGFTEGCGDDEYVGDDERRDGHQDGR